MYFASCLLLVAAVVIYHLESPVDPYLWNYPFDLPAWNEEWQYNNELTGSLHHVESMVYGPESLVLHPDSSKEFLYTSTTGGLIVEVAYNGSYVKNIFFVGGWYCVRLYFH